MERTYAWIFTFCLINISYFINCLIFTWSRQNFFSFLLILIRQKIFIKLLDTVWWISGLWSHTIRSFCFYLIWISVIDRSRSVLKAFLKMTKYEILSINSKAMTFIFVAFILEIWSFLIFSTLRNSFLPFKKFTSISKTKWCSSLR